MGKHESLGTVSGATFFEHSMAKWPSEVLGSSGPGSGHGHGHGGVPQLADDQTLGHPNSRMLAVSIAASYVRSAKGMNCFQPLVCFKAAFNECFPTLEDT